MRVTKTQPIESKLDLSAVRVELYDADAAAEPPRHARAIITIPGEPETVRADLALSDVLTPKALEALTQYRAAFVRAALSQRGFVEAPELEVSSELSDQEAPREQ
jgi:hypothetical protein